MNPSDSAKQPVCIIGAGLTGLAAAYQLTKAGHPVIVLESTLQMGGMVASFTLGQQPIEYIYHHIFTSDQDFLNLCAELEIADKISWHQPRDAVYSKGRIYPFSGPLDLLRFRPVPFLQRIRTGMAVLKAKRLKNWQLLEKKTAAEWLKKQGGAQAYDQLWQPLLRSKFDHDAEDVSAVWIWNKFKLRGHSRRHAAGGTRLGYMQGGFIQLIHELQKKLTQAGVQVLLGHTAVDIVRCKNQDGSTRYQVSCILENCTTRIIQSRAVIATVAGRQFANMAANLSLPESYLAKTRAVRFKADLCLIIRLKESLSPFYWTTVCDSLPFVVVVEHTHLTGTACYGGSVIYLSRYLDVADPLWTQPDGVIYRLFTSALQKVYSGFEPQMITGWRLCRTRYAQPVIGRDYSRQMPELNTPDPGIKLAGMAQIYPEDRGMNYAVRLGRQAAAAVSGYIEDTEKTYAD